MLEHRPENTVVAHIGTEAQLFVGLDGIGAGVLQLVGLDLVEQADAAAFLAQVEQGAAALLRNGLEKGSPRSTLGAWNMEGCVCVCAVECLLSWHKLKL